MPTPSLGGGRALTVAYAGGRWWDGARFVSRTMYVRDGRFVTRPRRRADSTHRLDGLFVMPPMIEAHTHTIAYVPARRDAMISAGVLGALIMNVDRSAIGANQTWFNTPTSLDAMWTVAAITAPDAHPVQIGAQKGRSRQALEGDWVTLVESIAELEAKWPTLRSANGHLIKVFLESSEQFAERRADPTVVPRYRGVDPVIVPRLVELAHASGLRVAAHVRTSYDFHVAVESGVDIIGHLPGFSMGPPDARALSDRRLMLEVEQPQRFRIAAADAIRATAQGTAVITTVGGTGMSSPGEAVEVAPALAQARGVRRDVIIGNLHVLRQHGVRIVVGSGAGEGTPIDEVVALTEYGVLSPRELLNAVTVAGADLLFPGQRRGRLTPGHDASFVAVQSDPVRDVAALRSVKLVVKRGRTLTIAIP